MNGWNIGAVIAAVVAIIGAATAWGQNVATSSDHERRIGQLEEKAESVNELAIQQAVTNEKIVTQTTALEELTKSIQALSRKINSQ